MTAVWSSLAVALALVFGAASVSKLRSPVRFQGELEDYRLLSSSAVPVVGWLIPIAELAVAAGLLVPATRSAAALAAGCMLAAFTYAIVVNLRRGRRDISCACFGSSRRELDWSLVVRNAILLAACLAVVFASPSNEITVPGAVVVVEGGVLTLLAVAAMRMLGRTRRWS